MGTVPTPLLGTHPPLSHCVCKALGGFLRALPCSQLLEVGIHHLPRVSSCSAPLALCRPPGLPTVPLVQLLLPRPGAQDAETKARPCSQGLQALVVKCTGHRSPDSTLL